MNDFTMKYHILSNVPRYFRRRVKVDDRKYESQEYAHAVCGAEVIRGQEDGCDFSIVPTVLRGSDRNWCHECVRKFRWTEEDKRKWREAGIDL